MDSNRIQDLVISLDHLVVRDHMVLVLERDHPKPMRMPTSSRGTKNSKDRSQWKRGNLLKWLAKETPLKDWDKDLAWAKLIPVEVSYNKIRAGILEILFRVQVPYRIELQIKWLEWGPLTWDKILPLVEMNMYQIHHTKDHNLIFRAKAHISSCNFTQQDWQNHRKLLRWEISQQDLVATSTRL